MRITNAMMTNTTLININRNTRRLDKLIQQIESTKKIQVPSDDPIVASRALKFRTSLAETMQFQRNIQSGLAWMEVTESSFLDITQSLLEQLRTRCVEGATGTEEYPDKLALVAEMRELAAHMGLDMNQTYAGRYVFSGFRTDQPPIFTDNNNLAYVITQQFDLKDIEKTKSFQKLDPTGKATTYDINILKLAYKDVDFKFSMVDENGDPTEVLDKNGNPVVPGLKGTGVPPAEYEVRTISVSDPRAYIPDDASATAPGAFVVHYIPETGELVFSDAAAKASKDGTTVTYYKEDYLKGELNPMVYFDVVEILGKETTELTVEIRLNGPPVNDKGMFTFSLNRTSSEAILDNGNLEMNVLSTTEPIITIGGKTYGLWNQCDSMSAYHHPGPPLPMWENTYTFGDVNVIQHVTIMDNNEYKIDYSVVNYGDPVNFTLTHNIHPTLGGYGDSFTYGGNGNNMTLTPTGDAYAPWSPSLQLTMRTSGNDSANPMADGSVEIVWSGRAEPDVPFYMTTYYGVRDIVDPGIDVTPGRQYNMDDQYIEYEFATRTFVPVNALAKNVYTDKMYADLRRLIEFAESLELSDPKLLEEYYKSPPYNLIGNDLQTAVNDQLTAEKAQLQAVLYDRFNNMLYLMDRHSTNVMKEHTSLGSRMQRLELLQARMEQDEESYTKLLSDNEDTDLVHAIVLKAAAEAAYLASLKTGANIVQMTLANFIG
jgi:flagellar hook-associated protein 3 FlgL